MTLSIVIANWNTRELIKQCIESIISTAGAGLEFEIIVIDNASSDGSAEYLDSLGNKIIYIKNNENAGYSKACNQGMKIAKGKYTLLLGSDTIMQKNTIEECVKFLDDHAEAGAAGCRLLNPDGSAQNSCKIPRTEKCLYTYLSLDS
jgi:GT2 family glycosyltransferase